VPPLTNGSYRNHCPTCLRSLHVDEVPGDRASGCGGFMRPVALRHKPAKGPQLVHRCERCGALRVNRVATGTVAPDDLDALLALPPG
jgi:RNHCP domain